MYQSHEFYLRRAIEISKEAREAGNTPFGALLVNKEGEIIMEQGNIEITEKILITMAHRYQSITRVQTNLTRILHYFMRRIRYGCNVFSH